MCCAPGTHCENTLPALEDLIRRDNAGELPQGALSYVEFDVHVSMLLPQSTPRSSLTAAAYYEVWTLIELLHQIYVEGGCVRSH